MTIVDQEPPASPTTSATVPPPARQRWWRNTKLRLLFVGAAVVLVVIARVSIAEKRQEIRDLNDAAKQEIASFPVGDCIAVRPASGKSEEEIHRVDCAFDPSYTVAGTTNQDNSCASANYSVYRWALGGDTVGGLCLMFNFVVGHCYHHRAGDRFPELVDCATTSDETAYKVVERHDNIDAASLCPSGTEAYTYASPRRTYCTGPTR